MVRDENWTSQPSPQPGEEPGGLEPSYVTSERALGSATRDLTRMKKVGGETKVGWKGRVRRMLEALAPEAFVGSEH